METKARQFESDIMVRIIACEAGSHEEGINGSSVVLELDWKIREKDRVEIKEEFKKFIESALDFPSNDVRYEDDCENCGARMTEQPTGYDQIEQTRFGDRKTPIKEWVCQTHDCYNNPVHVKHVTGCC